MQARKRMGGNDLVVLIVFFGRLGKSWDWMGSRADAKSY